VTRRVQAAELPRDAPQIMHPNPGRAQWVHRIAGPQGGVFGCLLRHCLAGPATPAIYW